MLLVSYRRFFSIISISVLYPANIKAVAGKQLVKLPKEEGLEKCLDSNSTFKGRKCEDIRTRPQLCEKEWIASLCPNRCNVPPTETTNDCCEDFEGEFRFKRETIKCESLSNTTKACKKKEWIRDLCPEACGVCPFKETAAKGNDTFVGIIENNTYVTSPSQPLYAKVPLFGPSSIKPYETCEELKLDLKAAASMIVNDAIIDNADYKAYDDSLRLFETREFLPVMAAEPVMADSSTHNSGTGESSYQTNVQVQGVDEADIIKSNGKTVFCAYGDKLIVWDAKTLKKLSVTVMPKEHNGNRKLSSFFPHRRQVSIRGLLLSENRLAVIVTYDHYFHPFTSQDRKILQNYGAVSLRLYDISVLPTDGVGELQLLATKKLQGNYVDARMIENTAHVVTTARIDTYYHLTRHFSRYTHQAMYANMSASEYTTAATTYAKNAVIPSFIQKFTEEADVGDNCTNLIRLTMFQSFQGSQPQKIYESPRSSIINGFAQVITFDMETDHEKELKSTSTSIMLPTNYNTKVYASNDKLVLATRGHQIYPNGTGYNERTYFQVLSLSANGTESHSVGEVDGYLLNQYSMDIWDNHLRLATTTSAKWGCTNDENSQDVVGSIRIIRPCERTMLKDSDNYVHVLRLPTNDSETTMEQVDSLSGLGKKGELIESVRFMKDKAFIVTFLRTDPFYTIDLKNHNNISEVGALEITGYSNYLHPYDEDGNIIIGVGQDADEDGRATGLQISLFDTTGPGNATLIERYSVENETGSNETNVWSSSAAQYDPKAFRFLPGSKKLILPTSIRNYENSSKNFDGFLIFDLSLEGIAFNFSINHANTNQLNTYCWYNAYLSSRSLVHDGIVTTTKGHTVLAQSLDGKKNFFNELNLDENNTECGIGGWWID